MAMVMVIQISMLLFKKKAISTQGAVRRQFEKACFFSDILANCKRIAAACHFTFSDAFQR